MNSNPVLDDVRRSLMSKAPSADEMATYKNSHPGFVCDYDFVTDGEHFMVYGAGVPNPVDVLPFSDDEESAFLKTHPEIVPGGPIAFRDGVLYTFQLPVGSDEDDGEFLDAE